MKSKTTMAKEPMMRDRKEITSKRPKRVPIHDQRNQMTTDQREGFVRRWVNDIPGRVEGYKIAGWELDPRSGVQVGDVDINNNNASLSTGAHANVGQGMKAVLMRIRTELYEADQKAKQKELDEQQKALRHKLNSGKDGTYGEVTGI